MPTLLRQLPAGPTLKPTGNSRLPDRAAAAKAAADKAREAALKASQEAKRLAGHAWKESLPFRKWAWLNLRIWVPFLATPLSRSAGELRAAAKTVTARNGTSTCRSNVGSA